MSGEENKEDIDRQLEQRDGQLPAHLDPANAENKGSGQGLTREHLFGPEDIKGPFDEPGQTEVEDKDAELDPDQGRKDEEDQAADTEAETGQEDEAELNELEDDETETAEQDDDDEDQAAGKDKPKGWDKQRQKQDQKIASLTRELADMKALLTAKGGKGTAQDEAHDAAGTTAEDDGLEELELPEADEFDDPDALAAERKRIAAHNRLVKATRDSRTELKALRSEKAQERAQAANKAAFEDILEDCDKRYGKEYRKTAIDQVRKLWKTEGFGPGNDPSAESTRAAVRGVYAELKAADVIAGKKTGGKTATKTAKTAAAGKLHGASRSLVSSGSLTTSNEQALQEVMAELGPRRRR